MGRFAIASRDFLILRHYKNYFSRFRYSRDSSYENVLVG